MDPVELGIDVMSTYLTHFLSELKNGLLKVVDIQWAKFSEYRPFTVYFDVREACAQMVQDIA